jgi:SAM-dependent methyltransferase
VLDDGAGVGGPAGWLAARRGVRPVCAEPMADAAGAAHRLFGLAAVVAAAQALPFPDRAFDAAWCLGVLCTITDKAAALSELRRVLAPGGRLGLLVFVADGELTLPVPEGNSFPAEREVRALLAAAGLTLEATADADLSDSPPAWQERADAVDAAVARRHGDDPRWQEAQEQSDRVRALLSAGELRAWLGIAVAG